MDKTMYIKIKEYPSICGHLFFTQSHHPGLAEIFAPDGVSGSDIIENFRQ